MDFWFVFDASSAWTHYKPNVRLLLSALRYRIPATKYMIQWIFLFPLLPFHSVESFVTTISSVKVFLWFYFGMPVEKTTQHKKKFRSVNYSVLWIHFASETNKYKSIETAKSFNDSSYINGDGKIFSKLMCIEWRLIHYDHVGSFIRQTLKVPWDVFEKFGIESTATPTPIPPSTAPSTAIVLLSERNKAKLSTNIVEFHRVHDILWVCCN